MSPVDIIICGAGGTGQDALDCLNAINALSPRYRCLGFLDDRPSADLRSTQVPVLGPLASAREYAGALFVDALGSPASYRKRESILRNAGIEPQAFLTLIHPTAVISSQARVGPGSVIMAYVVVGPGVELGSHVTVLPQSVIHHESRIGDWTILASHVSVSGRVRIGETVYVGSGAQIIQDATIGSGVLVGMGAVVIRDIPSEAKVAGNPARLLPRRGT